MNLLDKFFYRVFAAYPFYWRYRHLFFSEWTKAYLEKENETPIHFYNKFCEDYNIQSIFEFGCASGGNLFGINNFHPIPMLGYDVSKAAIELGQQKVLTKKIKNIKLTFQYTQSLLKTHLDEIDVDKFDLVILDRVLLYLNSKQLNSLFSNLAGKVKYVCIDDMFTSEEEKKLFGHVHRDYSKILSLYNFRELKKLPSNYPESDQVNQELRVYEELDAK